MALWRMNLLVRNGFSITRTHQEFIAQPTEEKSIVRKIFSMHCPQAIFLIASILSCAIRLAMACDGMFSWADRVSTARQVP